MNEWREFFLHGRQALMFTCVARRRSAIIMHLYCHNRPH